MTRERTRRTSSARIRDRGIAAAQGVPPPETTRPFVDRQLPETGIDTRPRRVEAVSAAFGPIVLQNAGVARFIWDSIVANKIKRGVLAGLPRD